MHPNSPFSFRHLRHYRLWHQLTVALADFVKDPALAQGDALIQLYNNVISTFESRLNQLSLVRICLRIATQYPSTCALSAAPIIRPGSILVPITLDLGLTSLDLIRFQSR